MSDYWQIGTVHLPKTCWPRTVRYSIQKDLKPISTYYYLPLIIALGPKVPTLDIEGFFWEPGKTLEDLEKDYIIPFRNMVWYGSTTRRILFDENGTAFWTLVSGTEADDTSTYVKGKKSYRVDVSASTLDMYHDWATAQNFVFQDFVSLWVKGANTSKYLYIYFYNEDYATKTNGYYYRIKDDFTWWRRFVIPKLNFIRVGDPTGWKSIKCVRICTTASITATLCFDRLALGPGSFIWSPFKRYNGIWILRSFDYEEAGGNVNSFYYKMSFVNQDDHY